MDNEYRILNKQEWIMDAKILNNEHWILNDEKWILNNLDYSVDVVIDNFNNLSKFHKINFKKLNKSNIELDLLSYSAVKLTLKFSDSS